MLGAYRFADGRIVSVRMSGKDALRYRVYQTGESRRMFHDQEDRYISGPDFSGKTPPIELTTDFIRDDSGRAGRMLWRRGIEPAESAERIV